MPESTGFEEFGLRIRRLLEERKLTQAELAKGTSLSPTQVSRLLSGDRTVNMDQAVAMGQALGLTVTELVSGTDAAAILGEWVPREEYSTVDRGRVVAEQEVSRLRVALEAANAQIEHLRAEALRLDRAAANHQLEVAKLRLAAARVEELNQQNAAQRAELNELRAQARAMERKLEGTEQRANVAVERAQVNYDAWAVARQRILALERDLAKAKGESVATAVVAAALAGVAGAMLATPAKQGRKGGA